MKRNEFKKLATEFKTVPVYKRVLADLLTPISAFIKLAKGIVNFGSLAAIMAPKHYLYQEPKNIFYVNILIQLIGIGKRWTN